MRPTMLLPRLNPNDESLVILHWYVANHAWVAAGADLVEVESAKATVTIPSTHAGYLLQAAPEGAVVAVGDPLAWFVQEPHDLHDASSSTVPDAPLPLVADPSPPADPRGAPAHFSPAALAYLEAHHLDPERFRGMGLVSLPMLKQHLERSAQPVPPPPPVEAVPPPPPARRTQALSPAKQLEIRLLQQGQAGGITSSLTVQFPSAAIRQRLADPASPYALLQGQLLPLILYELAQVLRDQPIFTAHYDQGQVVFSDRVDIGVAIDLDHGLKAPVIRQADTLTPVQLREALLTLVSAYQEQRLRPDELHGSTVTVSDLSGEQVFSFQPLLNAQQAVILGIGGDATLPDHPMTLTMVFDHRLLSGRQVSQVLQTLKQRLLAVAAPVAMHPPLLPVAERRTWVRRTAVTRRPHLPSGPFLLVGASSALRREVVAALRAMGQRGVEVVRGPSEGQREATSVELDPTASTAAQQFVQLLLTIGEVPTQILCVGPDTPPQRDGAEERAWLLPLLQALAAVEPQLPALRSTTLLLVSQGQQPPPTSDQSVHSVGSSLAEVLATQVPWLRGVHLDLQEQTPQEGCRAILRELLTVSRARAVVIRAGERWVPAADTAGAAPTLQPAMLPGWVATAAAPAPAAGAPVLLGALEQQLVQLWQEQLNGRAVGLHDPFFALGGTSLQLVQLWKRLQATLAPTLTLMDLFRHPTVAQLSRALAVAGVPEPVGGAASVPHGAGGREGETTREAVAIIGMAGRFPGASSLDTFWENLCTGHEAIQRFSDAELRAAGVAPALLQDPHYVKAGAILPDVDQFDAAFFGFTPRDAEFLDPQTRLFLEACWEALEHAGYVAPTFPGTIGLYAGAGLTTYMQTQLPYGVDPTSSVPAYQAFISNDKDYLTTRVAHKFNLRGPSVTVQTACSTSLVAIHLAKQSLLQGECDLALAGGVSVRFPHQQGYRAQEGLIFAPDGHCRAFDAQAQGTVFGHGLGVVVLKRLRDALADGDSIYAVVKGSAINNDGGSKLGYTAPSIEGQARVIRAALADAQVTAETLSYVETHGTGTPLGDPVEVTALADAFRPHWQQVGMAQVPRCLLGAVKTNIGHLDAAAGIAGVIKTTLALTHAVIPPTLHFTTPNPAIAWAETPFAINREQVAWERGRGPRRAGVSSFGVGGTNAHVILEEAPAPRLVANPVEPTHLLVTLSAQSEPALAALVERYAAWLATHPEADLGDVSYTTHVGRSHFAHRLALVAGSVAELRAGLAEGSGSNAPRSALPAPRVAFIFTGQGSQYAGMGQELYRTQPTFRAAMERCDAILCPILGESLLALLYPDELTADHVAKLANTSYAQPALFALEYALATLWQSWGVTPAALIGHSLGEYVAACIAGVFSLEDGLKLIAARGQLMERHCTKGAMFWVLSHEAHVRQVIAPYHATVAIAGANSPENVVISGSTADVEAVVATLAAQGVSARPLQHVAHAFHSPLMEPMLEAFRAVAATVTYHAPRLPLVADRSGQVAGAEITTADYWVRQTRETVRFADGIATLAQQGCDTFIEIGTKPTLLAVARQNMPADRGLWLPSLRPQRSDWQQLLESLGALYVHGASIDWAGFDRDYARRRVALPTYPFQRQRYWAAHGAPVHPGGGTVVQPHRLLHRRLSLPRSEELRFELILNLQTHAYVDHHRYYGVPIVPASTMVTTMLSIVRERFGVDSCVLQSVLFAQAMPLDETEDRLVQVILKPSGGATYRFELVSRHEATTEEEVWHLHATGDLVVPEQPDPSCFHPFDVAAIQAQSKQVLTQEQLYAGLSAPTDPFYIGEQLHWGQQCWLGEREAWCRLAMPVRRDTVEDYQLHPGIIEGPAGPLMRLARQQGGEQVNLMAFTIDRFCFHAPPTPGATLWWHIVQDGTDDPTVFRANTFLMDAEGRLLAEMHGFALRQIAEAAVAPRSTRVTAAVPPPLLPSLPTATSWADDLRHLPLERQQPWMEQQVGMVLRTLLGLPHGQALDPTVSFFTMGVDSLLSVEVRNQLQQRVGLTLPATIIFRYATIQELSGYLLQRLIPAAPGAALPPPLPVPAADAAPKRAADAPTDLQTISDAEAEARLLAHLAELESDQ